MTLSPKLGVVGISTLWHFRLPLPIQMFIKVASSPRLSGIGMPSPILWSHPLKMQRIVLLSSLLWWELGTNSLITGPGEWLSFRRFTSNYPDPDPWWMLINSVSFVDDEWVAVFESQNMAFGWDEYFVLMFLAASSHQIHVINLKIIHLSTQNKSNFISDPMTTLGYCWWRL